MKFSYFLLTFFLLLIAVVSFLFYVFYLDKYSVSSINVEIKRSMGLGAISKLLEEKKVVRDENLFLAFVVLNGVQNELKAGEYEFKPKLSVSEVKTILIKGRTVLRRVTIPEGYTLNQISQVLENKGILSKEEFLELAKNREYIKNKLGVEANTLEGFLFPETYLFSKNQLAEAVINKMVDKFFEVYNSTENNNGLDLNLLEIVTYASIIEKETSMDSEKKMISAVIKNRLEMGMKLDLDPTVIYALGDSYKGRLTKKDLTFSSPYNTYVNKGLPSGPIANPGKESIEAALNPADVDFLYFVSKGDGSHFFSNNYRSHVNAVKKYILKKN